MRGARFFEHRNVESYGIIPAYAGSTFSAPVTTAMIVDHPRVCGEHYTIPEGLHPSVGSSPRMRGAQKIACHQAQGQGIIPAYAGSTH